MVNKLAFITASLVASMSFAAELSTSNDPLTVAAIGQQKGMFKVRERHDMGESGVQEIDYVVNCSNQTMALAAFSVITAKSRITTHGPLSNLEVLSFYQPMLEHDQKITRQVCTNQISLNGSMTR